MLSAGSSGGRTSRNASMVTGMSAIFQLGGFAILVLPHSFSFGGVARSQTLATKLLLFQQCWSLSTVTSCFSSSASKDERMAQQQDCNATIATAGVTSLRWISQCYWPGFWCLWRLAECPGVERNDPNFLCVCSSSMTMLNGQSYR